MRNFLVILLILIAFPAIAQTVPGVNASMDERIAYMRQLGADYHKLHQEMVTKTDKELKEKFGIDPDHPIGGPAYSGCRYACVNTLVVNGKRYNYRVYH